MTTKGLVPMNRRTSLFDDACNVAMSCLLTFDYQAIYITQVQLALRIQVEVRSE